LATEQIPINNHAQFDGYEIAAQLGPSADLNRSFLRLSSRTVIALFR
jgi:hypothetical protein